MDTGKIANNFLEQLRSKKSKSTFEILTFLVEQLENKQDPDPVEMHLVESIYSFLDQFKRLENNLSSYIVDSRKTLPGNKLASLYEDLETRSIWK